jgi:hypothetical protein
MYTVLTTCPPYGSQNVGDKLIEQRTRELIAAHKGENEFHVLFREEPLDAHLYMINASRALLLPAFPVRDTPMYPGVYRLVADLGRIHVPLIPIGANWNTYPGDAHSRAIVNYSAPTVSFLHYVAGQVSQVSCREHYACAILARHGVANTIMTGDPAWFDLASLGRPMARPQAIERLAFSPPLSPYYVEQAEALMRLLAERFPAAQRFCAMHLADADRSPGGKAENSAAMSQPVAAKNRRVRALAAELGYEVLELAGRPDLLSLYDGMDLHVGYECHAHLYFLSKRRPSVLIAEDARGVGFLYTMGGGGFEGFARAQYETALTRKSHTSGYCTTLAELAFAPPRADLAAVVGQFLAEEAESGFHRYAGMAAYLDETYERVMSPFIHALP